MMCIYSGSNRVSVSTPQASNPRKKQQQFIVCDEKHNQKADGMLSAKET